MVRHDHEVMQPDLRHVPFKRLQEEAGPTLVAKEALSASRLEGDKVGLFRLAKYFPGRPHPFPPGLKPHATKGI